MKVIKAFILILILGSCATKTVVKSNEKIDFTLSGIINKLKSQKLNYIGFKEICIGSIILEKTNQNNCPNCKIKYETYILWNENKKSFLQKFDNCSEFKRIEIETFNPDKYLKDHRVELWTQNVEHYKLNDSLYSLIDHSCILEYWINDGQNDYRKEFDLYDLTTSEHNENLNYKYNNSLALVILNKKLNEIITELENNNRFVRDKKTCYNTVYN